MSMSSAVVRVKGRVRSTALVFALAAAGCGDRGPESPRTLLPSTAVVAVAAAATTILPPLAAVALDFELATAVYLGLNYGEWADGELVFTPDHPLGLARSWEIDGSSLTYRLDPDRVWSDGTPITSADVAFTFELLQDAELALPLGSVAERIDSLVVVDDATVVFHFDGEYPGMLFDTGVGILPAHVFADVDRSLMTGGMPVSPVRRPLPSSGPFTVGHWDPADRIELERNTASAAAAGLDRVIVRVVPDETTRLAELRAGSADAAQLNSFRSLRQAEDGGLRVGAIPQRGYDYIAWNPTAHPAFATVTGRRALSLAIDREAAIAALDMIGFAEAAWGPYGSLFSPLRSPPPAEPLLDRDEAARALDAAGWVDSDGDGIRDLDGRPLAFELAIPSGNDRREDAAELVRDAYARLGIEATVRPQEFNSLLSRMVAGEYEAALMGWQVGLAPDISMFWSDPGLPLNVVAYSSPETRASIESAQAEATAVAAAPHWRAAAARIAADYPYAFLWYFDVPFVTRPELEGVRVTPSGWGAHLWEWRRAEPGSP